MNDLAKELYDKVFHLKNKEMDDLQTISDELEAELVRDAFCEALEALVKASGISDVKAWRIATDAAEAARDLWF
jgi:ribosomal protein L29